MQDPTHSEFGPSVHPRSVLNIWDASAFHHPLCTPECTGAALTAKNDVDGHGSHCAGTVAGNTVGVAPSANLFGVKVLEDDGLGSFGTVIDA